MDIRNEIQYRQKERGLIHMEKFSDFISEQKNDEPYRVLIISHDDPDDPPLTSERFKKSVMN